MVFQDLVFLWIFGFFIGVFIGFVVSKLLFELVTAAGLFVTWVLILFFYPFQRAASLFSNLAEMVRNRIFNLFLIF
jgi:hypothetical protein